jgi:hypothetical protein
MLLVLASSASVQLKQPFVYTTGGAIAIRNDPTAVLAPTSSSPLAVLGYPAVLDAKGRFLRPLAITAFTCTRGTLVW